ncbi:hypothetical protein [Kribbella sp. NPDC003557]|uniref:type II toxin-antitoxin system HicB family antitoxin n=1 Tax=Kribbella sp. NPDC003557 TaxID=3154449 RepID=UPI0033A50547
MTVSREDRWWMVAVPELGGVTQARRLDEVEQMAREFIAVSTDVPLSKVAIEVAGIDADGQNLLEAKTLVDALRRRAKDLEALVAELTREVASALTDASVPVRDVSSILGVSHQRVSQLVQTAANKESGRKAMRQARQEFTHDLVIRLDDGRSLQLIEITEPKRSRTAKARTAPPAADRPARASATPRSSRRQKAAGRQTV